MTFYNWFENYVREKCDLLAENEFGTLYRVKNQDLEFLLAKEKSKFFEVRLGAAVFAMGLAEMLEGENPYYGLGRVLAQFDKDLRKEQE